MIHLKTYENFISKGLSKMWNKLTEPEHGDFIPAELNPSEIKKMESFGFTVSKVGTAEEEKNAKKYNL